MILNEIVRDKIGEQVDIETTDGRRFPGVVLTKFDGTYLYLDLRGMTGLSSSTVLHFDDIRYFSYGGAN